MQVYSNVLDMVGKTPMLEVHKLDTGPCELFLKLELANPGGSVKDRIGISMIEEAERRGDIKPGLLDQAAAFTEAVRLGRGDVYPCSDLADHARSVALAERLERLMFPERNAT